MKWLQMEGRFWSPSKQAAPGECAALGLPEGRQHQRAPNTSAGWLPTAPAHMILVARLALRAALVIMVVIMIMIMVVLVLVIVVMVVRLVPHVPHLRTWRKPAPYSQL
jgi:hypothetical protein